MRPFLRASLLALSPFIALTAMTVSAKSAERGLTALDLVQLERVSDPQLAPDGTRVSYTLRQTDYAANKASRSLWVLDIATRETRRLTAPGSNASDARWAANGDLYFLSSRSGSQQVWRLPAAGGEAQPVTELTLDVGSYTLSADASRIAFSLEVYPDCDSIACSKKRMDEEAARKTTGRSHEQLFIRHWDTWKDGRRNQLFAARLKDGRVQGEPVWLSRGLDGDVPSKPFGDASEYRFSPDGQQLVFTARVMGRSEAWSTNLDLWQVPSDGSAKPRKLTTGNEATDTGPVFSADGRTLYYRAMKRPGFEADRYALMALPLKGGTPREIAPDWDRSAASLTLSADGKTIYTHADDLGQSRLFAVEIASGQVRALTGTGSLSGYSVAGNRIVYTQNSLHSPDQIYLLNADGSAAQLTQHNAERLAGVRLGDFEQFSFSGWNNETVYGYVVKPWNYKKGHKYPVAFIIHGGPQGSMGNDWHYRWNPQTYAGQGYAVVFIDFHGSTGYGQKFTDSISGDWGGKPLEDLQKGWSHALKTYDFLDGSRAAALGASYGGYMINWIAGQWPDAFKALVSHCGIFDNRSMGYTTEELWFDEWELGGTPYDAPENYEKHNPVNLVKNWKTPMLVIHGEKDYRVPLEQGIATFTALQRRGIPSQFLHFPDENHWVLKPQNSVQWHEAVNAWLKRWIGN